MSMGRSEGAFPPVSWQKSQSAFRKGIWHSQPFHHCNIASRQRFSAVLWNNIPIYPQSKCDCSHHTQASLYCFASQVIKHFNRKVQPLFGKYIVPLKADQDGFGEYFPWMKLKMIFINNKYFLYHQKKNTQWNVTSLKCCFVPSTAMLNCRLINIDKKLSVTASSQFLDHGVILCLWKGGSVVVGVAHHHPQLHRLGNLSAIWTLHHNADLELTGQKKTNMTFVLDYYRNREVKQIWSAGEKRGARWYCDLRVLPWPWIHQFVLLWGGCLSTVTHAGHKLTDGAQTRHMWCFQAC